MRIKICGLSRDPDIEFVNEARPDYIGFVFAESKRQVSPPLAQYLRFRLIDSIVPVGVFVNASINDVAELFYNGTISIAQLHGDEDEKYITQLKKKCDLCQRWKDKYGKPLSLKVIKTLKSSRVFTAKESEPEQVKTNIRNASQEDLRFSSLSKVVDYFLIDSDSGSGKPFDWQLLSKLKLSKPWFLAGGVNIENIEQAMVCKPFAVDVSSGVETDGIKNREKIIRLTTAVKKGYVR